MSRFDTFRRNSHPERDAVAFAERRIWAPASTSALRSLGTRKTRARATRAFFLGGTAFFLLLALTGCREDMQVQPRYNPLSKSDLFADDRSSRQLVAGTVARGQLQADKYFYTGFIGKDPGNVMPFPVTREVLERGRERYNIYCAPCHSRTGDGNGMIVQRGYRRPPSYHIDRLRKAPLGHFFDVITNGFGAMPDYDAQVQPADRWAIIAYIRALQFSQDAPASLVPAGEQMPSPPPQYSGTPSTSAIPSPVIPGNPSAPGQTIVAPQSPPAQSNEGGKR
jgi:mono/diheme cytochrome c family protein